MNFDDYIEYKRNTPFQVRYLMKFLCVTGMRASEVFLISKNRLIYVEGVFTYEQPKTKILRTIRIPDWFIKEVREARKSWGSFTTIFGNYKNMLQVCKTFVQFPFKPKKGLNFFHNCRYLFVLKRLMEGKSDIEISCDLGHSELSTVKIYIERAREIYNNKHLGGVKNG